MKKADPLEQIERDPLFSSNIPYSYSISKSAETRVFNCPISDWE